MAQNSKFDRSVKGKRGRTLGEAEKEVKKTGLQAFQQKRLLQEEFPDLFPQRERQFPKFQEGMMYKAGDLKQKIDPALYYPQLEEDFSRGYVDSPQMLQRIRKLRSDNPNLTAEDVQRILAPSFGQKFKSTPSYRVEEDKFTPEQQQLRSQLMEDLQGLKYQQQVQNYLNFAKQVQQSLSGPSYKPGAYASEIESGPSFLGSLGGLAALLGPALYNQYNK